MYEIPKNKIRCISLWQPWASLMAVGVKNIETRSWPTQVRGEVAIHAARTDKGFKMIDEMDWHTKSLFAYILGLPFDLWHELPTGRIVAVGKLMDCKPTEVLREELLGQQAYGDFSDGRFGHLYADLERVDHSLSIRGSQGFFYIDKKEITRINKNENNNTR